MRFSIALQAFLDFRGFDFHDFRFTTVYNSILFSSPLVILSNLDLHGFYLPQFFMCPHINSVNPGMPLHIYIWACIFKKLKVHETNFLQHLFAINAPFIILNHEG